LRADEAYPPAVRTIPLNDPAAVDAAVAVLKAGGVIVHPTETCYGLCADLTNPAAVERLFALKERPRGQPVSGLFASVEAAKAWVEWTDEAERLAAEHLPGPLTLILPIRPDAPARLLPSPEGGSTLGVRVSSHPFALALAAAYGAPISTTSANRHGEPNPYSLEDLQRTWPQDGPDLLLDGGTLPPVPPSTVMDLTKGGEVRRQGGVGAR
jgi:L-threonylcarbamoyladenylate synthase